MNQKIRLIGFLYAAFLTSSCGLSSREIEKQVNAQGLTKEQATEQLKDRRIAYYNAVIKSARRFSRGPDEANSVAIAAITDNAKLLTPVVDTYTELVTWHMDTERDEDKIFYWREKITADTIQTAMNHAISAIVEERAAR